MLPSLITQFVLKIFPVVRQKLASWQKEAERCPNEHLAREALASIQDKSFHCLGGSIFALYPGIDAAPMLEFIVAYQTISDYLDNLTDRLDVQNEQAFAQLHTAMSEALVPHRQHSDYYRYYPHQDDGGYLDKLVDHCQRFMETLPQLHLVQEELLRLAGRYAKLQTYKHLAPQEREQKIAAWIAGLKPETWGLTSDELALATGSTLGIFCLCANAAYPQPTKPEQIQALVKLYDPWISGLHIYLDYLIDMEEDRRTDQLNFVASYPDEAALIDGYLKFWRNIQHLAKEAPCRKFHETVSRGLTAMYLSDHKNSKIKGITAKLLRVSGCRTRVLYGLCRALRTMKRL
ncbi:MAG: tetraprenyl-beta-curcumene synthase family protein [Peptococcaceae bacterium]|jgi:tetraprenyl-beta-curcumene synthase|nr:tetraprenyl-beta-curcumene synthase family protein [Peptococcaceae bacterium]